MPLLDRQRSGQQVGRIRTGVKVETGSTDKNGNPAFRPKALGTFRLTTGSKPTAEVIAAKFGGEITRWNGEYEVITATDAISVMVPPRDGFISQWYELWSGGECRRKCDSQSEQKSNGPCLCPHAADPSDQAEVEKAALRRYELAHMNPPRACKEVTRISVNIPDLPGVGIFRLDTSSHYAAVEIGDAAELMQLARDRGVFLPAILRIDHRSRVVQGLTKKYPVVVLEVLATLRDIVEGKLEAGGLAAQLPPAPGESYKALTGGGTANAALPEPGPAETRDEEEDAGPVAEPAQQIADTARNATQSSQVTALKQRAEQQDLLGDLVDVDGKGEVFDPLDVYLDSRRSQLRNAEQRRRNEQRQQPRQNTPAQPALGDDDWDPSWPVKYQ